MDENSVLTQKNIVVVFAYAPAGLGHLRVTEALYDGLPVTASPVLLGAQDKTIRLIHRITSIHPIARVIFEFLGRRSLSSAIYKYYLRHHANLLREQLVTILDERLSVPEKVIIVATHFGLAHELAAIKKRIEAKRKISIYLFVQVTDDTRHSMWYVEGASTIFVPSFTTKKAFEKYGEQKRFKAVNFEVISYPVSPKLAQIPGSKYFSDKKEQLDPAHTRQIHVALPISGAAVGTNYLEEVITRLHIAESRFFFHAVTKNAPFTKKFIIQMEHRSYVELLTSTHDRKTVDFYEDIYMKNIISLEVTKPSEQAFKALCSPNTRGGAILLLAAPLGPQEFENLDFLRRHNLLPTVDEQEKLFEYAQKGSNIEEKELEQACLWRALILPDDPRFAAKFIVWCLRQKLFSSMMRYESPRVGSEHAKEINPNGVSEFWKHVSSYVKSH